MFKFWFSKSSLTPKQLQKILDDWEYTTCKGSESFNQKDYQSAISYFEKALEFAKAGLSANSKRGRFMHFYTLSSMNLAHVLSASQRQSLSEKVLSDAHFNMLSLMMDQKQPRSFRSEARSQAELLMASLKRYLKSMGKNKVADSLEEEFYRLKLTSGMG